MTHKVTLTVELTVEAQENKTREEVDDFAYWLVEPLLEETKTSKYDFDGCQLNDFDITINN